MDPSERPRGTAERNPSPAPNAPEALLDRYIMRLCRRLPQQFDRVDDLFDVNAFSMYPYLLVRTNEAMAAFDKAKAQYPDLPWHDNIFLAIAVHPMYEPGTMKKWLDHEWDGRNYWADELLLYVREACAVDIFIEPFGIRPEPSLQEIEGLQELINFHGEDGGETAMTKEPRKILPGEGRRPRTIWREQEAQIRRPSREGDRRPGRSEVWDEYDSQGRIPGLRRASQLEGPDAWEGHDPREPVPGLRRARRLEDSGDRVPRAGRFEPSDGITSMMRDTTLESEDDRRSVVSYRSRSTVD